MSERFVALRDWLSARVAEEAGDRRSRRSRGGRAVAGRFTAPLLCERVRVDLLVMLAAMVPSPGERPADWWAKTGHAEARRLEGYLTGIPA